MLQAYPEGSKNKRQMLLLLIVLDQIQAQVEKNKKEKGDKTFLIPVGPELHSFFFFFFSELIP